MQPGDQNGEAVRRQLDRVLSSAEFARSERLSRFLRLVVERHLDGKDEEIKESLIGVEVFGRRPDYDPKRDSIVRTEASRLRARLIEYYAGGGKADPVIIELPKGGYMPVFRQPEAAPTNGTNAPRGSSSRSLWIAAALAALLASSTVMGWQWAKRRNSPIAIAVLPLDNLSHDPDNEYFADGLTDELIRNLSIIDGLAVRSQTSSFAFKGKPRHLQEAAQLLHVDYVLEGSVLRAGRQLRINAQLVRVWDDTPVWSGRFDRELTDVVAIQDEISRGIVNNLRLKLGRGRRRYEMSVEVYDLYLRARALPYSLGVPGQVQSIGPFEKLIAKDPLFAPAYSGLATAYASRSRLFNLDHPRDELTKMRAAAETAVQLDPLLAEAHAALGMVYAREGQWEQGEKSFRRAIQLDPNDAATHRYFAYWFLLVLGRIQEALQQERLAEKADPLSPVVHRQIGLMLIAAGRYDEGFGYCETLPRDDFIKNECMARARLGQGRTAEAIQILLNDPGLSTYPQSRGFLGYAYARAGRREEAERMAAVSNFPNEQALIFVGLGNKERALEALGRMALLGPQSIGVDLNYQEYSLLRGDPRLKAIRNKVGLPE